jgi:PadR family transcriptional regulator PadR
MKGFIGEFEELVLLTIAALSDNAYGVAIMLDIKQRHKRKLSIGALHTTLTRLEEKGFIKSSMGEPSAERGGRRKRFFEVTNRGKVALHSIKERRDELWALSKAKLSLTK